MDRILIVDDDRSFRQSLADTVASLGHEPVLAASGDDALALIEREPVDFAFVDLRMPGLDGLQTLAAIKRDRRHARIPVVLLTAHADVENTIEAMRLGAFDHLAKPIGRDEIASVIERALPPGRRTRNDKDGTDGAAGTGRVEPRLIGTCASMREVQKLVGIAASGTANVLILGETGTGKELVARAIHSHGDRAAEPFVAVNCAAIPADLLESELFGHERGAFSGAVQARLGRFRDADRGTLFLDEIGDMSLAMQAKLLRVLQDRTVTPVGGGTAKQVDVRLLAATHHDLVKSVGEGRFREDLFYRLNVLRITLPPLRERGADILVLAEDRLDAHARDPKRLSPDAAQALLAYRWPGNVRELDNVMQKVALVVRGEVVVRNDLGLPGDERVEPDGSDAGQTDLAFASAVARFEKQLLARTLAETGNNRAAAARRLGMHRQLLYAKLKEHGLG